MLSIFTYVSGPLYVFHGKLYRYFVRFLIVSFVFLVWSHVSSLYILDIKTLSKLSLKNIFFPFHFDDVFFSHTEIFNLMRSHLFILSFMSLALEDVLVKICYVEGLRFSYLQFSLGISWCHH